MDLFDAVKARVVIGLPRNLPPFGLSVETFSSVLH